MQTPQSILGCGPARALALLGTLAAVTLAMGQDLPVPRNHVDDRANVIQQTVERQLIDVLADLERKTGAQVIVLTVDTTGGVPIEDYALKLAERWQLGQKGKDNGGLIVIAVKDRKYRFELGYGIEATLPDGLTGSIGRKHFQPYFRRNDFSTGIYAGTLALVQKIATAQNVTITGAAPSGRRVRGYSFCGILPIILIVIVVNVLMRRRHGYRRWGYGSSSSWIWMLLLGSMMGGGRRGGWGGGGGFGGGGFGGGGFGGGSFGGGGGGGFGGGGASGGW